MLLQAVLLVQLVVVQAANAQAAVVQAAVVAAAVQAAVVAAVVLADNSDCIPFTELSVNGMLNIPVRCKAKGFSYVKFKNG